MTRPSSHRAVIPISVEAIVQALLPEGTSIHDVRYEVFRNTIEFYVTNPNLPEVCEGCVAPVVLPWFSVSDTGKTAITFGKPKLGWEDEWDH